MLMTMTEMADTTTITETNLVCAWIGTPHTLACSNDVSASKSPTGEGLGHV